MLLLQALKVFGQGIGQLQENTLREKLLEQRTQEDQRKADLEARRETRLEESAEAQRGYYGARTREIEHGLLHPKQEPPLKGFASPEQAGAISKLTREVGVVTPDELKGRLQAELEKRIQALGGGGDEALLRGLGMDPALYGTEAGVQRMTQEQRRLQELLHLLEHPDVQKYAEQQAGQPWEGVGEQINQAMRQSKGKGPQAMAEPDASQFPQGDQATDQDRYQLGEFAQLYKMGMNRYDPQNLMAWARLRRLFGLDIPMELQMQAGGIGGPMVT